MRIIKNKLYVLESDKVRVVRTVRPSIPGCWYVRLGDGGMTSVSTTALRPIAKDDCKVVSDELDRLMARMS